ncbi:MAG: hypothetical protein CMC89_00315 [Flavobacteriaceae bacterium]|nr:hypothetical protein [Flavobacteriaceae bacterium]
MGLIKDDLKFLIDNIIEIDSYKSKMGADEDIVTLAFSVTGEAPAQDLENFVEKGYPFVLDADVSSGEQPDGTYKVFIEMERNKDISMQILEIADGVKQLAGVDNLRFRYHKNFKSKELNNENIAETIPFDADTYTSKIKEVQLENYKNYFTNSYAESIELRDDVLTVKNTYTQPVSFKVMDFGKNIDIKENINMEDMAEVIWLTKYLGDYNINKYGKDLVLENKGYVLKLRRI